MRSSCHVLSFVLFFAMNQVAAWQAAMGQTPSGAGAPSGDPEDIQQIQAAITSYVTAFNARDVERLVGHWAPQGVYISRSSGDAVVGRDALREEFARILADPDAPQLAVVTNSIEYISPNVALERGLATVTYSPQDVVRSNYRAVYVQRDGEWLLDRVSEDELPAPNLHYEKLKPLEWLIGDWCDAGDDFTVEISCQWTTNQHFIRRTFQVTVQGETTSSGLQIIGWDAGKDQIVSWLFDSDGSVVTGTWSQGEGRWVVQSVASLAGGGMASSTSIFRPLEDGTYAWQKVNRVLDGELLPNIDEIVLQRK